MDTIEYEVDVQDDGMMKVRDAAGIEVWLCSRCYPQHSYGTHQLFDAGEAEDQLRDDVSDLVSQEGVVHYSIECEACSTVIAEAVR